MCHASHKLPHPFLLARINKNLSKKLILAGRILCASAAGTFTAAV